MRAFTLHHWFAILSLSFLASCGLSFDTASTDADGVYSEARISSIRNQQTQNGNAFNGGNGLCKGSFLNNSFWPTTFIGNYHTPLYWDGRPFSVEPYLLRPAFFTSIGTPFPFNNFFFLNSNGCGYQIVRINDPHLSGFRNERRGARSNSEVIIVSSGSTIFNDANREPTHTDKRSYRRSSSRSSSSSGSSSSGSSGGGSSGSSNRRR